MNWSLNGYGYEGVAYDINKSAFQLNAGIVYKFKNSNGSTTSQSLSSATRTRSMV